MNDNDNNNDNKPRKEAEFPTVSFRDSSAVIGGNIGPFKLLSFLGEGAYGIVYLAEQKTPIKRQVALKIIKPGMDSKQVLARFEAERQALALLDHPNIAHILRAGSTESGRPYFAMEYIQGIPITEYCDHEKLSLEDRLKLFMQVCEAIQHAHQKGIIHRDIKPSNIMVSVQEGKAIPKVIDFGVAKAMSMPLTDKTMFTQQGQLIGTPEYMSPEQADLNIKDIDTRTDIYSLGVVLYELLAGALPFDPETLREAGFAEIQRIIKEEEPPRPSTKLSSLGDEGISVAHCRKTELPTLIKNLHKELEWIPMMAMRKERGDRYRSTSEFADDILNYLNGDPLLAGPPSMVYRVRKYMVKHWATSIVMGLLLIILVGQLLFSFQLYGKFQKAQGEYQEVLDSLNDTSKKKVALEKSFTFIHFLKDWRAGRAMDAEYVATFLSRDSREAKATKFLLNSNLVSKEEFRLAMKDEESWFVEFVMAEYYLKNGDLTEALKSYKKCKFNKNSLNSETYHYFINRARSMSLELESKIQPTIEVNK